MVTSLIESVQITLHVTCPHWLKLLMLWGWNIVLCTDQLTLFDEQALHMQNGLNIYSNRFFPAGRELCVGLAGPKFTLCFPRL